MRRRFARAWEERVERERRGHDVPMGTFAAVGIGGLLALIGTYWDEAWHTEIELTHPHGPIEARLPVTPPESNSNEAVRAAKTDWAYHPAGAGGPNLGQILGGALLYILSGWLLIITIRTPPTATRSP